LNIEGKEDPVELDFMLKLRNGIEGVDSRWELYGEFETPPL